jgi:hypothetical protein
MLGALPILAALLAYLFLATAGSMRYFPDGGSDYYGQLGVAFASGQTSLLQQPEPAFAPDSAELKARYWDLSLREGRLFLYWGPVPATIAAALLRLGGWHFRDDVMASVFLALRAVFGWLVLARAKEFLFPKQGWLVPILGYAAFVFGAPVPVVLARQAIYEAAITGAQCFLIAGFYVAFVAVCAPTAKGRRRLLAAASVCWGLSVGCRVTQAPGCACLALLTFAVIAARNDHGPSRRPLLGDAAALASPLIVAGAILGYYNLTRFGSVLETGVTNQLGLRFHTGARFVVPNLYTYVLRPLSIMDQFPYVQLRPWSSSAPGGLPPPELDHDDYYSEPNGGFLWSSPFYALAVISAVAVLGMAWTALARRSVTHLSLRPELTWFAAGTVILSSVAFVPLLFIFATTCRYLLDVSSGLALAATLGVWIVVDRWFMRPRAHRFALAAATALTAATVVVSVALWFNGPSGCFVRDHNPWLYARAVAVFPTRDPGLPREPRLAWCGGR